MSRETVESIIGKAVVDSEFRAALFANPDQVLAGYDLTVEEIAALKAIDAESMESLAGTLDERISKSMSMSFYSVMGGSHADKAVADKSVVDKSVVDKSVVDKSVVDKSVVDKSVVDSGRVVS